MLTRRHTRVLLIRLFIAASLLLSPANLYINETVRAETSTECKDLAVVFLRGSAQNATGLYLNTPFNAATFGSVEPEAYSFFNWFKTHLDVEYPHVTYKATSVHNFPDKYDSLGYRAVGVGFPLNAGNTFNSEASWFPGEYRSSVEHGVAETAGYLKDQISSCPNQTIAVGGYSQGAQVMGDALFQLTPAEQAKIVGVGMFGDPKFIASTDSTLNPLDHPVSYPWRRGDATNKDKGMLDARLPYVPPALEKRTASYCSRKDMICSGWTGLNKNFREIHRGYSSDPMRATVDEMVGWARPYLSAAERVHGGLSSDPGEIELPTPESFTKSRDIMFLINDDSGVTVLQTFRYGLDPVLSPVTQTYTGTQYGAKAFGEGQDGATVLPRVNNVQALLPYVGYNPTNPSSGSSNLAQAFASRYPFAQPQMGGGDFADPHGLAIEKTVFAGGWRPDVEKHIVLITDRAPKQTYSYNICHATVRSWLQIPNTSGYDACYAKFGTDIWPKVEHPEVCETVYKAIIQSQCTNPIPTPGYTHYINRTLNDGITAAQAQNITVDVVVPYKITDQYNPSNVDKMINDLKYVAKSTGGKFIYYDQRTQYDGALLSDTLYQIFNHTPTSLLLAYKEALDGQDSFNKGAALSVGTNQPTILDVSQSKGGYTDYKWDFNDDGVWDETTQGPVTEHAFDAPQAGFMRVGASVTSGEIEAETRIALNVTYTGANPAVAPIPAPEATAAANQDGSITVIWNPTSPGALVIIDPASHLPIATADLMAGQLTFTPSEPYTELQIIAVTGDGGSQPRVVQVTPAPQPTNDGPTGENKAPQDPDPTLCYKLQQCNNESASQDQDGITQTGVQQLITPVATVVVADATPAVGVLADVSVTPQVEGTSTDKSAPSVPASSDSETPESPSKKGSKKIQAIVIIVLSLLAVLMFYASKRVRQQLSSD